MGSRRRPVFFFFLFHILCFLFVFTCSPVEGDILIVTDGNYSVGPRGQDYWLTSGPFFLHNDGQRLDTDLGNLNAGSVTYASSGRDRLGQWQSTTWRLKDSRTHVTLMEASIRTYPTDRPGVVIFTQTFPRGLNGSGVDDVNDIITGFPTFRLREGVTNTSLAYLMFAGHMMGDSKKTYGRWSPSSPTIRGGLDGSGPFLLLDQRGGVMILSPLDHALAASVSLQGEPPGGRAPGGGGGRAGGEGAGGGVLGWGVMGGVDSLPPGFALQTLLVYGCGGVGGTFRTLGSALRQWFGKTDAVVKRQQQQDITLTHLGYLTDRGAYYYYHTEKGKNYEQTLPDALSYAAQQRLPYNFVQIDSWFYPKDHIRAVTTWDAMPDVFPHGLRNLSAKLKLPISAHNRFWSVNTTYAKQNGGSYDFYIGHKLSLPKGQVFWQALFKNASEWGLRLYEQDWIQFQQDNTEILLTSVTAGADWLNDMARGARDHGVKVMYCTASSRHGLHSLLLPEVTQARISDDYLFNPSNWKVGVTSHFAAALGLAPFKDTFWSTSVQPGFPDNLTEPYPELQSAVATLSTGPVGPGDGINYTNRDIVMRCCAEDGLILKPSRPITAIDGMFLEMGFGEGRGTSGEVWSTYTTFDDVMFFGIIFAANVTRAYNVTPSNVGFRVPHLQFPQSRLFVRNAPSKAYNFSDLDPFDLTTCHTSLPPHFCLYYTTPVLQLGGEEVLILGELSKWVPMSPQRVLSLRTSRSDLQMTLRGQPGEVVTFTFRQGQRLVDRSVTIDSEGCGTIEFSAGEDSEFNSAAWTRESAHLPSPSSPFFKKLLSRSDHSASSSSSSSSSSVVRMSSYEGEKKGEQEMVNDKKMKKSCHFVPPP